MNCNHPLLTAFIVHCLEYWVEKLGVDGFRFDLASVFARGQHGELMADPPVPWAIEWSRILSRVPVIAEAWDAAGLNQVGAFPGMAWSEWNGRYRDVMRRFVRGDPGWSARSRLASQVAPTCTRRRPAAGNSINFITCHDGFTLADLVSYDTKHNQANGEDNRDGSDDNASWNCGREGESSDADGHGLAAAPGEELHRHVDAVARRAHAARRRRGLRSQRGNNNAWFQDNELSWFDWGLVDIHHDMLRFTREMIAFRRRHPCLMLDRFFDGHPIRERGIPDIAWHGMRLSEPKWHDAQGRLLAFTMAGLAGDEEDLHAILNMSDQAVNAALPSIRGRRWHVALDTSRSSPMDILERRDQKPYGAMSYTARPRSLVVLEARG